MHGIWDDLLETNFLPHHIFNPLSFHQLQIMSVICAPCIENLIKFWRKVKQMCPTILRHVFLFAHDLLVSKPIHVQTMWKVLHLLQSNLKQAHSFTKNVAVSWHDQLFTKILCGVAYKCPSMTSGLGSVQEWWIK